MVWQQLGNKALPKPMMTELPYVVSCLYITNYDQSRSQFCTYHNLADGHNMYKIRTWFDYKLDQK